MNEDAVDALVELYEICRELSTPGLRAGFAKLDEQIALEEHLEMRRRLIEQRNQCRDEYEQ